MKNIKKLAISLLFIITIGSYASVFAAQPRPTSTVDADGDVDTGLEVSGCIFFDNLF